MISGGRLWSRLTNWDGTAKAEQWSNDNRHLHVHTHTHGRTCTQQRARLPSWSTHNVRTKLIAFLYCCVVELSNTPYNVNNSQLRSTFFRSFTLCFCQFDSFHSIPFDLLEYNLLSMESASWHKISLVMLYGNLYFQNHLKCLLNVSNWKLNGCARMESYMVWFGMVWYGAVSVRDTLELTTSVQCTHWYMHACIHNKRLTNDKATKLQILNKKFTVWKHAQTPIRSMKARASELKWIECIRLARICLRVSSHCAYCVCLCVWRRFCFCFAVFSHHTHSHTFTMHQIHKHQWIRIVYVFLFIHISCDICGSHTFSLSLSLFLQSAGNEFSFCVKTELWCHADFSHSSKHFPHSKKNSTLKNKKREKNRCDFMDIDRIDYDNDSVCVWGDRAN